MFQRIKFLQNVIRNISEDKKDVMSDVDEQQILVHFKLKQDACSDVHTDLKMTTYVLWRSIQESSRKPQANCMDF
jgi:hypothetical protein